MPARIMAREHLPQTQISATWDTKISIAVDPVALITTDCITVTSAMRKHARWAHSSVSAILGGGPSMATGSDISRLPRQNDRSLGTAQTQSGQAGRMPDSAIGGNDSLASRWGLRGKKGQSMQDNPLLSAFARLRNDLRGCTDIRSFDIPSLLHPFLQVIRSSSTSAPITSLAIVAITKVFAYNLIDRDSPRLSLAMQLLSAAITHCRFEASDSAADEIVLLGILELMESMLSGPGGDLLGDESVCEMMETGLSMCCQIRLSDLLRRKAEMSMISMCQTIFERLKSLEIEAGEELGLLEADDEERANVVMNDPAMNGTTVGLPASGVNPASTAAVRGSKQAAENQTSVEQLSDHLEDSSAQMNAGALNPKLPGSGEMSNAIQMSASTLDLTQHSEQNADESSIIKPYSLPSIRELFRVLVDLLQPHNRQHGDTLRVMALRIIDVALEVAGPSIAKHPSLATLAKDDLCRYLFQLVRSENMALLNESLRVAGTLLATCREVLKLQQELFLSYLVACLHPRVEIEDELGIDPALYEGVPKTPKLVRPVASPQASSGRSTPVPIKERQKLGLEGGSRKPDAREAMVESIGALSRMPSYLVELYVNYDCEVDRSDLCEDLIGLLSRNAFPDSARWSTTNVPPLCLDSLLGYVQFVADRLDDDPVYQDYPDIKRLQEQRARKKIIIRGATKFNENPKAGIAFLASHGIVENPDDAQSVVAFLRGTTRISKSVLGEYLSKKSHGHLLGAFLDMFDFAGKRVDEALRDLLNSFRLPGESALIERIVAVFSEKYCGNATPEGIANVDAVLVLTYAIIMLNTDQHNPNVKKDKRMTYNDFARNLRGVNGDKDFAPEYLQEIYDSIKSNEIILPDEHNNKQAFDYAWEELLIKARTSGPLTMCNTNIYDANMFSATWKPIVATLSYVFMSASDDAVFSRVVLGFDQCAQIAAKHDLTDALDHIIFCLSSMSTLASDIPTNTALNTEVQAEKKSVMVSELAVKFGRDYKAQLACAVLFRLIPRKESKIRGGWDYIVRIWLNLFANSLLAPSFSKSDDLLDISPIPLQPPSQIIDREQRSSDGGLIQSFSSFLSSYAADDPPEPSEEELESTLCSVDCVDSCPMTKIFSKILAMPPRNRQSLVRALLKQLPEPSSPAVIVVRPDRTAPAPIRTNGHRLNPSKPAYDPSMVLILELATTMATRDYDSVALMGQAVADALQTVVRDAANVHPLILARAVFYLLYLLNASQVFSHLIWKRISLNVSKDHSFVRAPVILHIIAGYDQSTLEKASMPILKGLTLCIRDPSPLRNEVTNTPDFWSIIRSLHALPEAASKAFDLVARVVAGQQAAVTADNYKDTVSLLNEFAAAGSVGAVVEQKRDKTARRKEKPTKPANPRENEVVDRGFQAVLMIYQLTNRVPALIKQSHLERTEAWLAYWSPIFEALRSQCLNPCREIRHQAFSCLQNSLLSPELASADHQEWTAIFGEVLFPLISRLLRPEIYQTDPVGMNDTRVQAANLLCKIFLHYLVLLSEWDGMLDLWLRILDIMDRLMNSGQGDNLEEAVPESLKNILLVMADGGFIQPPSDDSSPTELWDETCKRVNRFLPDLIAEIFPQVNAPPAGTKPAAAQEQASKAPPPSAVEQPEEVD
ncbi:MAG: GDP/GTP exchange factor for ARF [Alectoria sarmentosa]|nr:MAG: GDP/GTP exchange factor for ARF [Alectoria sarmentosa]